MFSLVMDVKMTNLNQKHLKIFILPLDSFPTSDLLFYPTQA